MGTSALREVFDEVLVELPDAPVLPDWPSRLPLAPDPDWPSRFPLAPDVERPDIVDDALVAGVTVPVSCIRWLTCGARSTPEAAVSRYSVAGASVDEVARSLPREAPCCDVLDELVLLPGDAAPAPD